MILSIDGKYSKIWDREKLDHNGCINKDRTQRYSHYSVCLLGTTIPTFQLVSQKSEEKKEDM